MTRFPRLAAVSAFLLLWGVPIALTSWTAGAQAQENGQRQGNGQPPLRVMIVDSQRIMREAEAVRLLQQSIESERDAFREQLRQHEAELREADQELMRERGRLTNEEFLARQHDLEQRFAGYQSEIADRRRALEGRFSKGMRVIESRMLEIIEDIAGERDIDLVLPKSAVLLADSDYDATDEVMDRLNDILPRVVVPEE